MCGAVRWRPCLRADMFNGANSLSDCNKAAIHARFNALAPSVWARAWASSQSSWSSLSPCAPSPPTPPLSLPLTIMRISGPMALAAGSLMAGSLPPPRQAALRSLRHPLTELLLDRAIVIVFPGPASATGEDMVEFHLHGGRAVIAAVADALQGMEGLRPAVAGEFTRRALIAGRIDLAGAEGLGDLPIRILHAGGGAVGALHCQLV